MSQLTTRLAEGDQAAFAELYDLLADRLYGYLQLKTGSAEDASDLLQEIFTRLFRSRSRLEEVQSLSGYAFQVARRELIRWHRRRRLQLPEFLAVGGDEASVGSVASQGQKAAENSEQIHWALAQIPPRYREVVELKYFARLTFSEISEAIGKPPGTVATWCRRGLDEMRSAINHSEEARHA